jgi:hypothetical protein
MISSEVQRTLVKSPPELWAELSDPAALARHLGELGEIRITRVEPEQKVEWEAGETSGTVSIKPSGWGTNVRLTVTRELAEPPTSPDDEHPESLVEEPQPFTIPLTAAGSAFVRATHARLTAEAVEIDPEPEPQVEQSGESEPAEAPTQRRGFFARLFARRRAAAPEPEPSEETAVGAPPTESQPQPEAEVNAEQILHNAQADEPTDEKREPAAEHLSPAELPSPPAELPSPAAEHLSPAELPSPAAAPPAHADEPPEPTANSARSEEIGVAGEVATEEVTAVLTGVLDRLGEAHHRPFSRS